MPCQWTNRRPTNSSRLMCKLFIQLWTCLDFVPQNLPVKQGICFLVLRQSMHSPIFFDCYVRIVYTDIIVCMHACMHGCMDVCMYVVRTYVRGYLCIYLSIYVLYCIVFYLYCIVLYLYLYCIVCTYVRMYVCVYVQYRFTPRHHAFKNFQAPCLYSHSLLGWKTSSPSLATAPSSTVKSSNQLRWHRGSATTAGSHLL